MPEDLRLFLSNWGITKRFFRTGKKVDICLVIKTFRLFYFGNVKNI